MTKRQCFPCTACCEGWLGADTEEIKLSVNKPCVNCTNHRCGIYETRPVDPCRNFKCAWLAKDSPLPEEMKPIDCGAIVLLDYAWHDRKVVSAIPTGKNIPKETLEWLMNYARNKPIPLIFVEHFFEDGKYNGYKRTGYGPPSFIQAVNTEIDSEDTFMM